MNPLTPVAVMVAKYEPPAGVVVGIRPESVNSVTAVGIATVAVFTPLLAVTVTA